MLPSSLLPARCRPRLIQHNLSNKYRKTLLHHSRSSFMKTHLELITPTPLPLTPRSPKKASSKRTWPWSQCVASSSLPSRCTRASSSVVSVILPLARCVLYRLFFSCDLSDCSFSSNVFLSSRKPSQSVWSLL